MSKEKKDVYFINEKRRCYTAACELGYPKSIRDAIQRSNSLDQIYRLLKSGREMI